MDTLLQEVMIIWQIQLRNTKDPQKRKAIVNILRTLLLIRHPDMKGKKLILYKG
jgi:hypothetical protein